MRTSSVAIAVLGTAVTGLCVMAYLVAFGLPLSPPTPPMLLNVRGGGGWSSACPPISDAEARMRGTMKLAISPDFDPRLTREFPAGTAEATLVKALASQGFKGVVPCKSDPSIRYTVFAQEGGGLFVYPMTATVYWKVNELNVVEWTKGFVSFTGL